MRDEYEYEPELGHAPHRVNEKKEDRLRNEAATWNDWRATCGVCGRTRIGTIAELMKPCPCLEAPP